MAARLGKDVKTIGEAWRIWSAKRSPRILAVGLLLAVLLRGALGGLTWRDAAAAAAMLVIYPFGEWAIHVYLLHAKPIRVRARTVELPTTRDHRYHHRYPNNLMTLLLDPKELAQLLLIAVPAMVVLGGLVVGLIAGTVPVGALLSAALAGYVLVGVYEWTHYLIHSDYRPRNASYKKVWRNHRLHHCKNEHY